MHGHMTQGISLAVTIGATAKAARQVRKLTQADVAERVGTASEAYGRMERGLCMPSVPTLTTMAGVLGFSTDEALGLEASGTTPLQPHPPEPPPALRRLLRCAQDLPADKVRLLALLAAKL